MRKNKNTVDLEAILEIESKTDIEGDYISSELSIEIYNTLELLPEPYKGVFSLRVFGELNFKEIGYAFGKSDNWACVTYHRAKLMIRKKLEEKDENHL